MKSIKEREMYTINPKGLYSLTDIEMAKLIPSKKKGSYAKTETLSLYIKNGELKPFQKKMSTDNRAFYLVKGEDIIKYLEKYRPEYKIPI